MTRWNLPNMMIAALLLVCSIAVEAQLHVTPSGDVGIGTTSPAVSLEVRRTDGTAQLLVDENSSTTLTRNLFKLENKGLTKFIINNTTGAEWAFANKGTSFRISRQGSGVVEMEVFNNGNVTIQGSLTQNSDVNAKTHIEAIDKRSVLERISDMTISQWQYKDALGEKHIGPMAQDFYAAFGLGVDEKGISTIDTAGVALVAIQALAEQNRQLADRNHTLEQRVSELELQSQRVDVLEAMVMETARAQKQATLVSN